jgi:hypothetical protein
LGHTESASAPNWAHKMATIQKRAMMRIINCYSE